jgi:hypothetical protein
LSTMDGLIELSTALCTVQHRIAITAIGALCGR